MSGTGSPTRLFLVRHGEVEGEGHLHGHVDVRLTATGVRQMEAVAERLRDEPLAAVYSSDLQRTVDGAALISKVHGLTPTALPVFRELDMGEWDGRSFKELLDVERVGMKAWWGDLENYVLPGGESLAQLRERVMPALDALLERHRGETVCLVAHGGVNRVVLFDALGLPLARFHSLGQDYGCLNRVEYFEDGRSVLGLVNG